MTSATECTRCGTRLTAGARFCVRCGTDVSGSHDLSGAAAATVADPDRSRGELLEALRAAVLGEYEVFAELGSGGMATVFLAHDIQLDRKVAIKVMLPSLFLGSGMAERFKLEARTAANLSHPHIIPIYAVKETANLLYFVMKFVDGRALDSILTQVGELPIPMIQTVLTKVGEALGYAHRNGVVHRDVKPANIMIDVEGMPVVTDFGIAKVDDTKGLTMTGATIGTPTYMSPEQAAGSTITGATDQYSLGVVAFEMLTGRPPFEAETSVSVMYKHCHEPPPSLIGLRPDCPQPLVEAVERMLAKDPAHRWPTIEEALSRIGRVTLAYEDPVRTEMIGLAMAGENRELLRRISTPRSPMPVSRGQSRSAGGQPPVVVEAETVKMSSHQRSSINAMPKPGGRRVAWWGAGLVALVAAFVGVVVLLPRSQPAATQPAPQQAEEVGVASLAVAPEESALTVGETVQLSVSVVDASGNPARAPETSWTSDNPAIASVTATGLVTARAAGNAVIRVRGAGREASSAVAVAPAEPIEEEPAAARPARPAPVAAVAMADAPATLTVGETRQLRAVPQDQRGMSLSGRQVRWSSSDAAVVRVSASGVVSALGPGTVSVTATSEGRAASVSIVVVEEPVARVTVAPANPDPLEVGASIRLVATAWGAGDRELWGREATWSSGDMRVATVSSAGTVTAVGQGETAVQVSVGGRVAAVTVAVNAAPAESPPAAVDPRVEIAAVIDRYAQALESKDLTRVRSVFPSIGEAQASQLEDSFAAMRDLVVTLSLDQIEVNGDLAQVVVSGTYEFYNTASRRDENVPVSFQISLRRQAGNWRITETH